MIWITLLSVIISFTLVALNVHPFWLQILAFAASASLFIFIVFQNLQEISLTSSLRKKASLFLIIGLIGLVNAAARRYEIVWDLSKEKVYSLKPETIDWIQKINTPLQILVFLKSDDKSIPQISWLKQEIRKRSSNVIIEIKNINREVTLAKKYGISQVGETVLTNGNQWIKVSDFREQSLVRGIIRLLSRQTAKLCFLTGHGEPDLEDSNPEGLSQIKSLLIDLGYMLETVSLTDKTTQSLSEECALLVVVSPKTSFFPQEMPELKTLWEKTPFLLAAETPVSANLVDLLKEKGLEPSMKEVINQENLAKKFPLTDLLLQKFEPHPILASLTKGIFIPQAQALLTSAPWRVLLQTPMGSGFQLLRLEDPLKGPYILAAVSEESENLKRVFYGTGKFLTNRYLSYGDNQKLALNSLRWLLNEKEENLPVLVDREPIMILSSNLQEAVKYFCFYLFPGMAVLFLALIWLSRQKQRKS